MTFYLTGSVPPSSHHLLDARAIGFITSPNIGNTIRPGWLFACDNGCFSPDNYVGDDAWFGWLERNADRADDCLFATAPDVVGDAQATLDRSLPWLPRIRALGYPAALVAQDGLEALDVPWDAFDVLFIGGSTEWKLGPEAASLALRARRHGKRVHMGRVNSRKRLRYAAAIGCDTADGTFLAFGPDVNVPKLAAWVRDLAARPFLPLHMIGATP